MLNNTGLFTAYMKRRKQFEPLQPPGVPTFTLTAGDAQIVIASVTPGAGGTPTSYEYQLRRRNAADSRWQRTERPVSFTAAPVTITQYTASVLITNDRRHQVRLRAINDIGISVYSDWQNVTPTE